jgi:hypothetical protein
MCSEVTNGHVNKKKEVINKSGSEKIIQEVEMNPTVLQNELGKHSVLPL